jgi:hypothetical protein
MAAAALGGTVLVTGVMAAAAFTMAVHDWLHVPTVIAAIVGIGWGMAIMNLDRWMLLSTRRQASAWKTAIFAIPRVLLAVLIGFVIAEPLVLRVFESDVTIQAKHDRQIEKEVRQAELKTEFADIPVLESEKTKLQHTIASGPTSVYSGNPDYDAAKEAYDKAQDDLAEAQKNVGCEAEGTCGTGKAGCGPVCEANQEIAAQRQEEADRAEAELNSVMDRLRQQSAQAAAQQKEFANPELARVNQELSTRRAEYDSKLAEIEDDYQEPIGLLDRKEALAHLAQQEPTVAWTTWLLRLFLIAIDITPVLFKTLLLIGKPSPYELAQEEIEQREHDRLKATEEAEDKAHRIHVKLIVEEAEIQAKHIRKSLEKAHEEIAATQEEVWRERIDDWRKAVKASSRPRTVKAARPGAGGGAITGTPAAVPPAPRIAGGLNRRGPVNGSNPSNGAMPAVGP